MADESIPYLLAGPPEQVQRKFELLRRQNDERNKRMIERMKQAEHGLL